MSEDKTPSDSRQWNHGEQKLTYTKDATTLSHSKYHLEWVKDVITPRKPSQKSAALFGWWPPQRKKNWVFFFVFAPEAQRLFPWAPVHCFYPTNCTAVMKHANQRFKMLYVWGKAKPLGHCFNLTMQKHTGPWLFDLINIKDHICTPWSKRSLLPAASLTPSGCVISWATAFSPPPSGT